MRRYSLIVLAIFVVLAVSQGPAAERANLVTSHQTRITGDGSTHIDFTLREVPERATLSFAVRFEPSFVWGATYSPAEVRIGGKRAVEISPDIYDDPAHPEHSGQLRAYQLPVPQEALARFRQGKAMWLRFSPGRCQFGPDKILEVKNFAITVSQ